MRKAWVLALVGSLTVSSAVVSQQGIAASNAPAACLTIDRISKYNVLAPNRLLIQGDATDFFQFETAGTCPALDPSMRFVLEARGRETVACVGKEANLTVRDSSGARKRCTGTIVGTVAPEGVAAMLKGK
jgi:hypothetical protein